MTLGPGTLHVLLCLSHPAALVPCDARRLVNRHVRPLLRALTKAGALTHYFGRDWISSRQQPVGEVAFAHDSETNRAVFEAFVAVSHPFAPSGRGSFLGKEPATLASTAGRAFDLDTVARLVVAAYADGATEVRERPLEIPGGSAEAWVDPPWAVSVEEAIGVVAAGVDAQGVLRLGGDLLASRDAIVRIERRVALASPEAIGAIVDEELGNGRVAVDGVRSFGSVRDVLVRARAAA